MRPYGSPDFKMLLLLQITTESFQFFSEFSSQCSMQNYFGDFFLKIFKIEILTNFSRFPYHGTQWE